MLVESMEDFPKKNTKIDRVSADRLMKESEYNFGEVISADTRNVWGTDIMRNSRLEEAYMNFPAEMQEVHNKMKGKTIERFRNDIQRMIDELDIRALDLLRKEINETPAVKDAIVQHDPKTVELFESPSPHSPDKMINADPATRTLLRLILGETEQDVSTKGLFSFWSSVIGLPEELLVAIAANHTDKFMAAAAEFEGGLGRESIRSAYTRLRSAIRSGLLPVPEGRLAGVFHETHVLLVDSAHPSLEEVLGYYAHDRRLIGLSSILTDPHRFNASVLEKTVLHEYLHALEGRTYLAGKIGRDFDYALNDFGLSEEELQEIKDEEKNQPPRVSRIRGGLGFPLKKGRLEWLNEAVTERIVDMLTDATLPSYKSYRATLAYLMEEGTEPIYLDTFVQAYFEDLDPRAAEKIPHWRALRKKINVAHGPGFFNAFDKAINEHGPEGAIAMARKKEIT